MKLSTNHGRRLAVRLRTSFLLTIFMLLLAAPRVTHAQAYNGAIVGNVTDASGASVAGAQVTVTEKATNNKTTAITTAQGSYTIPQLPGGFYDVMISAANFKEFVSTGVEVHVSTNTSVNAVLQVGAVSEKITVQADAVSIDTTSAAVGEIIGGTQVRELPLNGENFVGLTQLSPGVSAASSYDGTGKGLSGGVNFSVNGNPYTNNLFLVDGVNNNDVGSGRTILVYPAVDTISEFKMIRNSFGPEYGQASGAIISITTRSGQNQFHGGTFYSGRNDLLDANDYISNNNDTGKAKLRRSDWGYFGSGPIKRDKIFLWWNQEWNREIRGGSFGTCVPTDAEASGDFSGYGTATSDQCGAALPTATTIPNQFQASGNPLKIANPDAGGLLIAQFYPSPNFNSDQTKVNSNGYNWASSINNPLNWSEWNVRPDWDINSKNRVTFRWTQDSWTNPSPNNGSSFWGESNYPTVQSGWSQPSKSVMAKLSTTISSSMVNDVEFGYGHNAIITTLGGTRADIVGQLATAYPSTFPTSIKTPGEFFGGWGGLNPYGSYQGEASFWNIAPYKNHEDLYTVQDNLSRVQGNHLLKAGGFFSTNEKVENSGNGTDRPTLPTAVHCDTQVVDGTTVNIVATPGHPACVNSANPLLNVLIPGSGTTAGGGDPQEFNVSENSVDATAYVKWHDFEFYVGDTWKIRRNLSLSYGFRWSFYREPFGDDNHWANWSLAKWNAAEAASNPSDACNGTIIVPGTTPCADANKFLAGLGVNLGLSSGTPGSSRSLIDQNNHDIAPRVGLAWDVYGNGKTAVRLGGGQFFQREIVGIDEGMARTAPFVIGISSNRPIDSVTPIGGASVSPSYGKDPTGHTPNSWQWNATVEQEVAHNTTLEIGYVGNTGLHLTSMESFNPIPQSNWVASVFAQGSAQNALRPASNFGPIGGFGRYGHASYHSLQTLFRSQVGQSTFQAAYTWSHSIGDVVLDDSSGSFDSQASTVTGDSTLDKGSTNINRPNIFVANEVFFLPKLAKYNKLVKNVLGGWEANSIFTAAHGSSLTVFANGGYNSTGTDPITGVVTTSSVNSLIGTGYAGNNRPLSTGISCNAGEKGNQILNASAFTLVGYTLGTVPKNIAHRGTCFGAPTTDLDGQLAHNWEIKEKYRIKFAMDFFDMLNHPNFNTSSLEGAGYAPASITCGDGSKACSTTNNVVTAQAPVTGFGSVQVLQNGRSNRELQYSFKFQF